MVKTTVYLDDDLARSLRSASRRRGKPQAELIREALRNLTQGQAPPLPAGLGKFDSGRADTSERRKEILKQAARTGRWRS